MCRNALDDEDEDEDEKNGAEGVDSNTGEGDSDTQRRNAPADDESEAGEPESTTESDKKVPPPTCNWVKHVDKATGKPYFHDTISNTTTWEAPEHYTETSQPTTSVSAEYLEYLHRSRAEKLARATQRALDPEGNLSRLNALLSKIGGPGAGASSTGGADEAEAVVAPEDIEQSLKNRARAVWQQHVDPHSQRYYYHNIVTGETQWHKPDAPIVSAVRSASLHASDSAGFSLCIRAFVL
jgi:hypothetical protein